MCKVICVCNQKGGVAKSVTVCNLGVALAMKGKRVLVIDGDSQGSLTASLGYHDPDGMDVTLATIMEKIISEEELMPGEGIIHHSEGIDLMPANIELASLEVSMINLIGRESILKQYVNSVKDLYDWVIIDCNPSLGMITINALTASDSVLTPLQASYLPVKGLQQLIKTISIVKRQLNPQLEIEGILLTMVDSRTSFARDICELIRNVYGSKVRIFHENIPRSVRVEEATAEGVSIFTHDKNGKVAKACGYAPFRIDIYPFLSKGTFTIEVYYKGELIARSKINMNVVDSIWCQMESRVHTCESQAWTELMTVQEKIEALSEYIRNNRTYSEVDCKTGSQILFCGAMDLGVEARIGFDNSNYYS